MSRIGEEGPHVNMLRYPKVPIPECLRPWFSEDRYQHPTIRIGIAYHPLEREPGDLFKVKKHSNERKGSVHILLNPKDKRHGWEYETVLVQHVDFLEDQHKALIEYARGLCNDTNFLIEAIGGYLDRNSRLLKPP